VLVAVVALIAAIVALTKVNMTGQGIFEWFKKESTTSQVGAGGTTNQNNINKGLLGDAFVSVGGDKNSLKGYEAKYDDEGRLIYEIAKTTTDIPEKGIIEVSQLTVGDNYNMKDVGNNSVNISANENDGSTDFYWMNAWCGCGSYCVTADCSTYGNTCFGLCHNNMEGTQWDSGCFWKLNTVGGNIVILPA